MSVAFRLTLTLMTLTASATAARGEFAQFRFEASNVSGAIAGQSFQDQHLLFTMLLDTGTGTATFGGGGGSTIYNGVATSAWLDISDHHFVQHGVSRLFLTEDEGVDYLVSDAFGLHTTFWRIWNDGPFSDPSFERPLSTVLIPGKYYPLPFLPVYNDPLPNRISGTFLAIDGSVVITSADIQHLTLSLIPSPGTAALGVSGWLGLTSARPRRPSDEPTRA
jgi:hypothetical protein